MADKEVLKALLSNKYDPAEESPSKFRQSYTRLVEHRDELRRKAEAKDKRRAEIEMSKGQSVYRGGKKTPTYINYLHRTNRIPSIIIHTHRLLLL